MRAAVRGRRSSALQREVHSQDLLISDGHRVTRNSRRVANDERVWT
jgi:hypothetical protein